MTDAFSVGAYLLALVLLLLLAGWLLAGWLSRHRDRPSPADHQAASRIVPVSADAQRTVVELLRRDERGRALLALRRETGSPLNQLRELVRVIEGHSHPRTDQEAVAALHEQHPKLGAELQQVVQRRSRLQAVRWLLQHLPLGLITARDLVDAQRTKDAQ